MRNTAKFSRNRIKYNIFENYLSYWGYLLALNLQIYLETSSLKRANNDPKLPGVDCVAKNWALAMMLKALPLVHFWSVLLLKEQMMTSVRKTLKTLVCSAQNRSISDKIFPKKITTQSAFFYQLIFGAVCPKHSRKSAAKSADLSVNLPLKIPRNLTFFGHLSEAQHSMARSIRFENIMKSV